MTIKIEQLRCLVTVAESGNLADAAERLSRTPAALSMMLKQLERHLGQPLFESDRKNRLSSVGAFVVAQARTELAAWGRSVLAIEQFAQGSQGRVRLAVVPSVAGTLLPIVLKTFTAQWPEVQIDVRDMDSASVVHELEQDRIDLGLASLPTPATVNHHETLFSDVFGLVCSGEHPLACESGPVSWDDLQDQTFISNDLSALMAAADSQELHRQARLHAHNTLSLLALVKANLGVTLLPELAMQLDSRDLSFRPLADARATRRIELLHQRSERLSPAAVALMGCFREASAQFQTRLV